jgi:hypothetical protein
MEYHRFIQRITFNSLLYKEFTMAGGDRRGPAGLGPMTGRRMGYCVGNNAPGWNNGGYGRGAGYGGGFGRGRAFAGGFGRGFGAGLGRGFSYGSLPLAGQAPVAGSNLGVDTELDLARQADMLEAELQRVRSELEAHKAKSAKTSLNESEI